MKNFFFDRKVVTDHFGTKGKSTLNALSRAGAYVRQRARSMLRRRKKIAAAGQAPSIHTTDETITLKNIQFAYDFPTSSVVVGSVLTNGGKKWRMPVPRLLESGGTVSRNGRTYTYQPHPWMGPAMKAEIEAGTIANCWDANLRA